MNIKITHEQISSAVKNRDLDDRFCVGKAKYILHEKTLWVFLPTQAQYVLLKEFHLCANEREEACIEYLSAFYSMKDERNGKND